MALGVSSSNPPYYTDAGVPAASYVLSGVYVYKGQFYQNSTNSDLYICIDDSDQNALVWILIPNKNEISTYQAQADWGQSNNALPDYIKNKPTIPAAQIQSDWTQSNSSSVDFIKNKPAAISQSSASRSLNSGFQISATRNSLVSYSVDIATTLSLTTGQTGTVFLEIASDSGFTTNLQEIGRTVNGNTGTLTLGLNLTQNVTATLGGLVPAGYYCRLRTQNTVGTPTFNYRSGQEILF